MKFANLLSSQLSRSTYQNTHCLAKIIDSNNMHNAHIFDLIILRVTQTSIYPRIQSVYRNYRVHVDSADARLKSVVGHIAVLSWIIRSVLHLAVEYRCSRYSRSVLKSSPRVTLGSPNAAIRARARAHTHFRGAETGVNFLFGAVCEYARHRKREIISRVPTSETRAIMHFPSGVLYERA